MKMKSYSIPWSNVASTVAFLLLAPFFLFAQQRDTRDITGKVADNSGNALAGVSVSIKGLSSGTTTNGEGLYKIKAATGDVLVFSYVGFGSKEITVSAESTYNLSLQVSSATTEEVVVIGYGTAKRKQLTSSIVNVKPEDLNRGTITDV